MLKDFHSTEFITITIDGESACGKNSLGFALEKIFNLKYIDSGSIVRLFSYLYSINETKEYTCLVNWSAYEYHSDDNILYEGSNLSTIIRSEKTAVKASEIGKNKIFADYFIFVQREIAKEIETSEKFDGVIFSGRNGGYLVFPHAQVKLFLTALPEIRAKRRFDELSKVNNKETYEEIYNNIVSRDKDDRQRQYAALKPAENSVIIDTSNLTLEQVIILALSEIKKYITLKNKNTKKNHSVIKNFIQE